MRKILLAAALLLVATNINAQTHRDAQSWSNKLLGGIYLEAQQYDGGEWGFGTNLSLAKKVKNSNVVFGLNTGISQVLSDSAKAGLLSLSAVAGYRCEIPLSKGSKNLFYIYPQVVAGVGQVAHHTYAQDIYPDADGNIQKIHRKQSYFAWSVSPRIELGFQFNKVAVGVYASRTWHLFNPNPTEAIDNMEITSEFWTNSPFSAGLSLSYLISQPESHKGGNNVPLIEGLYMYGNRGQEFGSRVLWNINDGSWILKWSGKPQNLRGEFSFSHQVGARFSQTTDIQRITGQVGMGLQWHPWGPKSLIMFRGFFWTGFGELQTSSKTSSGEGYHGAFSTIKTTWKNNVELDIILHIGRITASLLGGASIDVGGNTNTEGNVSLDNFSTEKRLAYYVGGSIGFSIF